MINSSLPKPPADLGPEGVAFWGKVVSEYVLEDHHKELLRQACRMLDLIAQCRELVKAEGPVIQDRFGKPVAHPALESEIKLARGFKSHLRELQLDVSLPPDSGYDRAPRLPKFGKAKR